MTNNIGTNPNLTIHQANDYHGLPLLDGHAPYIREYLDGIHRTIFSALSEYPRTFAARVDLHLPEFAFPIDSAVISRFTASFNSQIRADQTRKSKRNKRTHPCRVRYVWVKEKGTAIQSHYHLLLLFNHDCYHCLGDFGAGEGNLAAKVKRAWARAIGYDVIDIGGLVHFPKNGSYRVITNAPSYSHDLQQLFKRVSYFAKVRTKCSGDRTRSFGCSRN